MESRQYNNNDKSLCFIREATAHFVFLINISIFIFNKDFIIGRQ